MLAENEIFVFYKNNFHLIQHHKYNLSDVENMLPFERTVYVDMLSEWIAKENKRIEAENNNLRRKLGH